MDGYTASEPAVKRFRSVKEYRENKKNQRLRMKQGGDTESSSSNVPEQTTGSSVKESESREVFVKLLKDTVARLCFAHFEDSHEEASSEAIPEWRIVSRIVSQALLEKEARLPPDVRFNVTDNRMKENAVHRIRVYTRDYLDRKYPR